jgi:hypothetical protein
MGERYLKTTIWDDALEVGPEPSFFDVLQPENYLICVFLSELVAEIIIVRVFLYTHLVNTKKETYNAIYGTQSY